jgi:hypothetical protein
VCHNCGYHLLPVWKEEEVMLINRAQGQNWLRAEHEPKYGEWSPWEECRGTEGLTEKECRELVEEWTDFEECQMRWVGFTAKCVSPDGREEFMIVEDDFDLEWLNEPKT